MGFVGPYALAVLARATDDAALRAPALAEGESVLRQGSVGHNYVWYYRAAEETQIEAGNWQEAERCAEEILAVTSPEPLPLVQYIAARIKALCAVGRGERGQPLRAEIDRLIAQGNARGHRSWVHSLQQARESAEGHNPKAGSDSRPGLIREWR
jgi:hypothetical protein